MTDRRLTPANTRIALRFLGARAGVPLTDGTAEMVHAPLTDLCRAPDATRDRELLMGAMVTTLEHHDGWAFVQNKADGYVGYVASTALGPVTEPTHFIATPATHAYSTESFKSRETCALSFGARVQVTDERHKMFETQQGFIPKKHLRPLSLPFTDPATVAQLFFGVPYLWGGNSTRGIDCSGLIQAALTACNIYCPADSDMQYAETGQTLPDDTPLKRGDLVFWKGHVGMMVDPDTLLHANAHHMACVYEPLQNATIRIKAQGDGDITVRKRIG